MRKSIRVPGAARRIWLCRTIMLYIAVIFACVAGMNVRAEESKMTEDGARYRIDRIVGNDMPVFVERGVQLTEEMLPDTVKVYMTEWTDGDPDGLFRSEIFPVTWNTTDFKDKIKASTDFELTGTLALPENSETGPEYAPPVLQIVYRDKAPITDLFGVYRAGTVTIWFNTDLTKAPYYIVIPDSGRVSVQFSRDGQSWESEDITGIRGSYTLNRLFDGTPVWLRLYVESGLQAGYSNMIQVPKPVEAGGYGSEEENDGGDNIGGNRGGGTAVLPNYQEESGQEAEAAGLTTENSGELSNGGSEAGGQPGYLADDPDAGEETAGTDKGSDRRAGQSGSRKKEVNAAVEANGAGGESKGKFGGEEKAPHQTPLWVWIAGLGAFAGCIAAGALVLKLIGYYKHRRG